MLTQLCRCQCLVILAQKYEVFYEDFFSNLMLAGTPFLCKQRFFSNQRLCCLTFFMNQASKVAQMLINADKHRHTQTLFIFSSLYLCLDQGLFMSFLCDLFLFRIFIFIITNLIISLKQIHMFFAHFFRIYPIIFFMWMKKANGLQIGIVHPQGIAQLFLNFVPISA